MMTPCKDCASWNSRAGKSLLPTRRNRLTTGKTRSAPASTGGGIRMKCHRDRTADGGGLKPFPFYGIWRNYPFRKPGILSRMMPSPDESARPAPAWRVLHRWIEVIALLMACLAPWAFGAVHAIFEWLLFAGLAVMVFLWGTCWVL